MTSGEIPRRARVGVVGAGSWGTALALLLFRKGHDVTLWSYDPGLPEQIQRKGESPRYLPGVAIPSGLKVTHSLEEAVSGAGLTISVSPSQFVADVMQEARPYLAPETQVVSASKGIETGTLRRMDQVFQELLTPDQMERFTVLSGPSFAQEVAQDIPTAVVVASGNPEARHRAQEIFQADSFRVYTNADVIGVELGGALKNVIALAAGAAAGLGLGHNTRAALITRGLAEMSRLGVALGARASTFSGLAGLGDLVLTCTGELSRNRTVGARLGAGETLEEILSGMHSVAEGVRTAPAVARLAEVHGVEMPITFEVVKILEGKDVRKAVHTLMTRDPKAEQWG